MAVIEINQLKSYNKSYNGLVASGQILPGSLQPSSVSLRGQVYHLAGENFAALFPGKSSGETLADLEQIRKAVKTLDLVLRRQDQVCKRRDRRTGTDSTSEALPVTSASASRIGTTPLSRRMS